MCREWLRALLILLAVPLALTLALLNPFGDPPTALATDCPGPDTSGYTCTNVSRGFVAGTTLVAGSSGCDDCVITVTLPFTFNFYGTNYTTANVISNGDLQFGSSNSTFTNSDLPNANFNDALFPFWDDQVTTGAGQGVFTTTQGSAPNRVFVIEWRTGFFSGGGGANYEVQLEETTNHIYFVYAASSGAGANGASATSGIQRGTGTSFLRRSFNTASLTAGSAVRFAPPVADLSVVKTGPATVLAGQQFTYAFAFANNGPSDALNVTATDQLPGNVTFLTASPSQGTISSNGTGLLTFNLGTIVAGGSATASVVVSVAGNVANNTTLSNTVTTTTSTTDIVPGNNTSTVNTTVINRADLSVTMTDTPDPVQAGNNLTYTFAFANSGPSDAVNVTATDQLPGNVTFLTASPSQGVISSNGTGLLTFTMGAIAAGGSATATVVVHVNPSATPGSTITNTATVASSIADLNNANNTASASTTVLGADLSVTQTASPNPVLQGQNVSYTITVSNPGPNDAQSFQLVDNVPANTAFVSETHPAGFACTAPAVGGTGPITCTRATFVAGVSAVFTVVVRLNAGTPADTLIANSAAVSSTTPDPSAANNTAIATVSAARQNVGVQVTPGAGRLQSTITARNAGCGPNDNRLLSLHFTRTDNATVDVLGQVGRSGDFTVPVSPPAQQVNFFINRLTAGQAATVRLIVTDGCGTWETLAGGGNAAFPAADAQAPAGAASSTPTSAPSGAPTAVPTR